MMAQARDIRDAVRPDETLFVVDAMIGQDAVTTARAFLDGVGFDGVVLTKLDGDARGGAALSVASVTGRPVMFASAGEKLADFDVFHPERMASRILDLGDVLTLIEQAEKVFDASQAEDMARKLQKGTGFTLEDFLGQLQSIRRMGPIKNLIGMLPGAGQMRDALDQLDDRDVDRIQAIIRSMTPAERENPKIINGSRRSRIARGSGTQVSEVNQLVERFFVARDMMSQAARGGFPGMPGLPGMPGAYGKKSKGKQARKGKQRGGRSGNPAKRAAELAAAEAAAADRQAMPKPGEIPTAFGGGGAADFDPAALQLPDDVAEYLKKR
jgi:signal recognition particle subunit SRP54